MIKTQNLLQPKHLDFLEACFDTSQIDKGILIWKVRPRHHFKNASAWTKFNTRYAGSKAGKVPCQKMPHVILGVTHPELGPVRVMLHRLIWLLKYRGSPPKMIDHINRIPFDNRPSNLRATTHRENMANRLCHKDCLSSGEITQTKDGKYLMTFRHPETSGFAVECSSKFAAKIFLDYLSFLYDGRYAPGEVNEKRARNTH